MKQIFLVLIFFVVCVSCSKEQKGFGDKAELEKKVTWSNHILRDRKLLALLSASSKATRKFF